MQQFKEDPGPYEWGISRPRKGVRKMPTERDARETVDTALRTWGQDIDWFVAYRKVGGKDKDWVLLP